MKELIGRFIREEDGMGTVEMVVIVAVLLGIALIFRKYIFEFVGGILGNIFGQKGIENVTNDPLNYPTPTTTQ